MQHVALRHSAGHAVQGVRTSSHGIQSEISWAIILNHIALHVQHRRSGSVAALVM